MTFKNTITFRIIFTFLLGIYLNIFFLSNVTFAAMFIYLPMLGLLFSPTRYASYVFIGRVIFPISIALLIVFAWITMHANADLKFFIRNALRDSASINDFFSILSTLYAICIAFLLWKGLNDYDNLRNILREEASCIQSINEFFHYIDEDGHNGMIVDEIRDILALYVQNIMRGREIVVSKDNERFLKTIVGKVSKLEVRDENDVIALSEIMKELSNLSHIRSIRSSYMETRMSPYLLALLVTISCFLLLPFILKEPTNSYVLHILIFSLTSFFSFLYITLLDINNPFDGYWKVKTESFANVAEFLSDDKRDFNDPNKPKPRTSSDQSKTVIKENKSKKKKRKANST